MINITGSGRLTRDSSMRFTADGSPVLGFSVACDTGFGKSKATCYLNCSLWGARGQSLEPYLKKGMPVTVVGSGSLRTYKKNDGEQGASLECNVNEVVMQGSKGDSQGDAPEKKQSGFRKPEAPVTADDFVDDDLPF